MGDLKIHKMNIKVKLKKKRLCNIKGEGKLLFKTSESEISLKNILLD